MILQMVIKSLFCEETKRERLLQTYAVLSDFVFTSLFKVDVNAEKKKCLNPEDSVLF